MHKLSVKPKPYDPFGLEDLTAHVNEARFFGSSAESLAKCETFKSTFLSPQSSLSAVVKSGYLSAHQNDSKPKSRIDFLNSLTGILKDVPELGSIIASELKHILQMLKIEEQHFLTEAERYSNPTNPPLVRYTGASLFNVFGDVQKASLLLKVLEIEFPNWADVRLLVPNSLIFRDTHIDDVEHLTPSLIEAIRDVLKCAHEVPSRRELTYDDCMNAGILALRGDALLTIECAHEAAKHFSGNTRTQQLTFDLFTKQSMLLWAFGQFLAGNLESCRDALKKLRNLREAGPISLNAIGLAIGKTQAVLDFTAFRDEL